MSELVDGLIREPSVSDADVRAVVGLLVQHPSAAGGCLACVELDRALVAAVGHAWRRGWQPADLARLVGRELGPRCRLPLVDAMAAAMAPFAGTPVHPAWGAQLHDLGARPWWPRGQSPLDARSATSPSARVDTLVDAVRVARFLAGLPPVPVLLPPPGSPVSWADGQEVDGRVLAKVRALLAKAESTTFPEEAEALSAKAQELMARHEIDAAVLSPRGSQPDGRRIPIEDPYAQQKAMLLQGVAEANGCRSVWSKEIGVSTVVGFDDQLAFVELLYTSLLVQATSAMVTAGQAGARSRQATFRRSFLWAYASRVGERLAEASRHVVADASATTAGADLLPVLAERRSAVDERMEELFPAIERSRMRRVDPLGWSAGTAAANRADLGQTTVAHGDEERRRLGAPVP